VLRRAKNATKTGTFKNGQTARKAADEKHTADNLPTSSADWRVERMSFVCARAVAGTTKTNQLPICVFGALKPLADQPPQADGDEASG